MMAGRTCDCGRAITYSGHGRPRVHCEACRKPKPKPRKGYRQYSTPGCPLTDRQLSIVRLLAEGLTYKQIASNIGISASTIRTHLNRAYKCLGVFDRAQVVLTCERQGWLGTGHASDNRECVLLEEIKALLTQYVKDLAKARPHRVTPKQRSYLDAFDAYIRRPNSQIEDDMIRAFEVMTEEAGVVVLGRQRQIREAA